MLVRKSCLSWVRVRTGRGRECKSDIDNGVPGVGTVTGRGGWGRSERSRCPPTQQEHLDFLGLSCLLLPPSLLLSHLPDAPIGPPFPPRNSDHLTIETVKDRHIQEPVRRNWRIFGQRSKYSIIIIVKKFLGNLASLLIYFLIDSSRTVTSQDKTPPPSVRGCGKGAGPIPLQGASGHPRGTGGRASAWARSLRVSGAASASVEGSRQPDPRNRALGVGRLVPLPTPGSAGGWVGGAEPEHVRGN